MNAVTTNDPFSELEMAGAILYISICTLRGQPFFENLHPSPLAAPVENRAAKCSSAKREIRENCGTSRKPFVCNRLRRGQNTISYVRADCIKSGRRNATPAATTLCRNQTPTAGCGPLGLVRRTNRFQPTGKRHGRDVTPGRTKGLVTHTAEHNCSLLPSDRKNRGTLAVPNAARYDIMHRLAGAGLGSIDVWV